MDLIQPIFQVLVLQATEWKCEGDRVAGIATGQRIKLAGCSLS
jgi:hypothetical protein